ncbi:hypothetical protein E2C01_008788 [Portunus trituberculatus]|uniref:Uncharacterized protein n=1 Tax=Portunus trituberculatus TaxID=210409 RepID=A0A5B7D1Q4_PORTR|nr:hypothetical protein [Portunus trituberculatus]
MFETVKAHPTFTYSESYVYSQNLYEFPEEGILGMFPSFVHKGLTKRHRSSAESIDLAQMKQSKIFSGAHDRVSFRDRSAMAAPMVSVQPSVTPSVSDWAYCDEDSLAMKSSGDIVTAVPRGLTLAKSTVRPDPRPPVPCRNGGNSRHSPIPVSKGDFDGLVTSARPNSTFRLQFLASWWMLASGRWISGASFRCSDVGFASTVFLIQSLAYVTRPCHPKPFGNRVASLMMDLSVAPSPVYSFLLPLPRYALLPWMARRIAASSVPLTISRTLFYSF